MVYFAWNSKALYLPDHIKFVFFQWSYTDHMCNIQKIFFSHIFVFLSILSAYNLMLHVNGC